MSQKTKWLLYSIGGLLLLGLGLSLLGEAIIQKRATDCSMGPLGQLGFDRNQHGSMPGRASRYRKNKMEIGGLKVG